MLSARPHTGGEIPKRNKRRKDFARARCDPELSPDPERGAQAQRTTSRRGNPNNLAACAVPPGDENILEDKSLVAWRG